MSKTLKPNTVTEKTGGAAKCQGAAVRWACSLLVFSTVLEKTRAFAVAPPLRSGFPENHRDGKPPVEDG